MFPHSRPYFSVICLNICWNVQGWTVPFVGLSVLDLFLQREMSLIGNIPGVVQIPWDELLDNWLTHIWVYMWCLSRQHWPLTQMPGHAVEPKLSPLLSELEILFTRIALIYISHLKQNNYKCKHQEVILEAFIDLDYIFPLYFLPFFFFIICTLCNSIGLFMFLDKT